MNKRQILLFSLGVAACVAAAWTLVTLVKTDRGPGGAPRVVATGKADIGGPFSLVDHNGRAVTDADFRGKHMLVFFGFTHCPDVCPLELQTVGRAMDLLGEKAEALVPVFISVDPARDTPEQLKGYVPAFHPRMVGLTGSPEQVAAAAKAYRVYYRKAPGTAPGAADYQVDHTAFTYLMGPDGEFLHFFRPQTGPAEMAEKIAGFLD